MDVAGLWLDRTGVGDRMDDLNFADTPAQRPGLDKPTWKN